MEVHKIKMAYNREEVCGHGSELYFTELFFGERYCAGQKETDLCKNEDKYLGRF